MAVRYCLILFLLAFSVPLWGRAVYLKPSEALKIIFRDSKEIVAEKKTLTTEQKGALEKRLGAKVPKETWNFYVARTDGRIDGYAVIDNEVGKTEPITFLTAINPDGTVKEVEILAYRESIGSEVGDERFRRQYRGKRSSDPIRVGQDIRNISGATLSARGVSNGVRRDLAVWEVFYGKY